MFQLRKLVPDSPKILFAAVLFVCICLTPASAQKGDNQSAQQQTPGGAPIFNPLKVALLKWFPANVTTSFPSGGTNPEALTFDGANIWVANNASGTVVKIRASDGATLGAFNVPDPAGLCFDGANIWVTSAFLSTDRTSSKLRASGNVVGTDNTLTKVRASDGKVLGIFTVGNGPIWPAFDGANVWVPNAGDNTVSKIRASDGTVLGTFPAGVSPSGTAFDGSNIWVTNFTGNTGLGSVTKLRASDGAVLGTFTVGYGPWGIAFDGCNMWIANANGGNITKLRASDGAVLGTFSDVSGPFGVAFDGKNVWFSGGSLLELRARDGKQLLDLRVPGNGSTGIAFDGANIWITQNNVASIGKY